MSDWIHATKFPQVTLTLCAFESCEIRSNYHVNNVGNKKNIVFWVIIRKCARVGLRKKFPVSCSLLLNNVEKKGKTDLKKANKVKFITHNFLFFFKSQFKYSGTTVTES